MPRYILSKEVQALQIAAVEGNDLLFTDPEFGNVTVDDNFLKQWQPSANDWFIVDGDDKSIVTVDVFENEYAEADEDEDGDEEEDEPAD
jgi:hypothetical protein